MNADLRVLGHKLEMDRIPNTTEWPLIWGWIKEVEVLPRPSPYDETPNPIFNIGIHWGSPVNSSSLVEAFCRLGERYRKGVRLTMSKTTIDLWLELSRMRLALHEGEPTRRFYQAFIVQLDTIIQRWLAERDREKRASDPLVELSSLRVMAEMSVGHRQQRDATYAATRAHLLSTLDAWWEQFKKEHDGPSA
jgi:hypothetical protein